MKARIAAVALATLLALSGPAAAAPSFDCAKAASVAEKAICADPALAKADARVAQAYAAALKRLDAPGRKALETDEQDFLVFRDTAAQLNEGAPKDKQNFDLREIMSDRATFLGSIVKPASGFTGIWESNRGEVEIKAAGAGKLEIATEIADPISGGRYCGVGGMVEKRRKLKLVDTDENGKPTGLVFYFQRAGDALTAEETGQSTGERAESPSCGANGHVFGVFFLTTRK